MTHPLNNSSGKVWHSSDFLIRLARGETVGPVRKQFHSAEFAGKTADEITFGSTNLSLVEASAELFESGTLLRSTSFVDRDLVVFGARAQSTWALDVLAGRATRFAHDWSSLRVVILRAAKSEASHVATLGEIRIERLYAICELLHERDMDSEAERALLRVIATRAIAGETLPEKLLTPFIERLLQRGLAEEARGLLPRLEKNSWLRHAFATELEHPMYGGSVDSMLLVLNEPYRRLGLESLTLDATGETPFQRLDAEPQSSTDSGPLVTVIMTCWNPGAEILTAVRSIVKQTYQNWELIVSDDASSLSESEPILEQVAALDSRVRIVRNDANAGTYVRRNEAIQAAKGELVTMQDSDDWSHPRRLEIQVRDLLANPTRLANIVYASRATHEFSVVSSRGAKLFLSEPSLMFRRDSVVAAIGYYDSIRKSADTEFRKRLEAATKRPVAALVPGAPLKFMLADTTSLSGADFGTNIWNHPDRLTYWSATRRYLQRIESGAQDPYLPFPQAERLFHAPETWRGEERQAGEFDLVVVLDGREVENRSAFHATVVEELKTAAASGLRVAFVQSDSLTGPQRLALLPAALQELIDMGVIARVEASDAISASCVIVRHAGAAQGHRAQKSAITAHRCVVVEEPAAGDARGQTIAEVDVNEVVTAWFEVEPEWTLALPSLPVPSVEVVVIDKDRTRLTIATTMPGNVRAARLRRGDQTVELSLTHAADGAVTATCASTVIAPGDWLVSVAFDAGDGDVVDQDCLIGPRAVLWNRADRLAVRVEDGQLRLLPREGTAESPGSRELAGSLLTAVGERANVVGDRIELAIATPPSSSLVAVYALREVNGTHVRRREFTASTNTDGQIVWKRPLAKFADARWHLFGTFSTPFGPIEFPISLTDTMPVEGTERWRPRVLSGSRFVVGAPPEPRLNAVTRRVARAAVGRLNGLRQRASRGARTSARVTRPATSRVHFDAAYSEPRIDALPKLSIVMPVYNVEPYLDAAITAVLEQDFADFELIIVDDASTDNGWRIIEKHWKRDRRLRVFGLDHNTLGGAGVPSNIGIRAARGTYVAFADSDDHVTKSGIAKLVELADSNGAELVIGDFRTFKDKTQAADQPYDHAAWKEFPVGQPISAFSHPALFRLSPVPWRKLYRRDFLEQHDILYPEGDYFYEDNPLHWFVLSRAHRVVTTPEVVSFHRQEREGQTMSAQAYKLGAFVNHANIIFEFLDQSDDDRRDVLFEAFYAYLDRCKWAVKAQTQPAAAALLRRGLGDIYERARAAAPSVVVPARVRPQLATYGSAYPDIDLTIVIPVFNSADLLRQTIESALAVTGIRTNLLLVDDGSTDGSLRLMREYEDQYSNVHVFAQGNRGAGRARNSVIPLCTGRYTFFLDADDLVDPHALTAAVKQADTDSADLMFAKYRIEYTDEKRSQGMFKSDRDLWSQLPQATSNDERQRLLAQLINYPWNRIIRTSLLHDANIFFGPTIVHNDVLFHWHSIVSARNIGYLNAEVCIHRKFAKRAQVTNIDDERRMAVLEALRGTHERISHLESYANVREAWSKFALHLIDWAKGRIPDSLQSVYAERSSALARSFE